MRPNSERRPLLVLVAFCAALLAFVSSVPAVAPDTAGDHVLPDGWFFTQGSADPGRGYSVRDGGTDAKGNTIAFWSEFQRLGGLDPLGYPIGQRYVGGDGFTYQPFQRALLQWRPERRQAVLANIFETLSTDGSDRWLAQNKGIPLPIPDDGSSGDLSRAIITRMAWLTDDAIKGKFATNPNPKAFPEWNLDLAIQLYGLPMSRPEQFGPFVAQRFQRTVFQRWIEGVSGMPPKGTVVAVLGGSLMREAGLLPSEVQQPQFAEEALAVSVAGKSPWRPPAGWPASPASGPRGDAPLGNFGVVEHGVLYRSAQPTDAGYQWLLNNGFKSVVSFRGETADDSKRLLDLGFRNALWLNITDETSPSDDDAERFLQFVSDSRNWPILIHCKVGLGRTGSMAALVRYTFDGWTMQDAIQEAKLYRGGVDLVPSQTEWLYRWARNHPQNAG